MNSSMSVVSSSQEPFPTSKNVETQREVQGQTQGCYRNWWLLTCTILIGSGSLQK